MLVAIASLLQYWGPVAPGTGAADPLGSQLGVIGSDSWTGDGWLQAGDVRLSGGPDAPAQGTMLTGAALGWARQWLNQVSDGWLPGNTDGSLFASTLAAPPPATLPAPVVVVPTCTTVVHSTQTEVAGTARVLGTSHQYVDSSTVLRSYQWTQSTAPTTTVMGHWQGAWWVATAVHQWLAETYRTTVYQQWLTTTTRTTWGTPYYWQTATATVRTCSDGSVTTVASSTSTDHVAHRWTTTWVTSESRQGTGQYTATVLVGTTPTTATTTTWAYDGVTVTAEVSPAAAPPGAALTVVATTGGPAVAVRAQGPLGPVWLRSGGEVWTGQLLAPQAAGTYTVAVAASGPGGQVAWSYPTFTVNRAPVRVLPVLAGGN